MATYHSSLPLLFRVNFSSVFTLNSLSSSLMIGIRVLYSGFWKRDASFDPLYLFVAFFWTFRLIFKVFNIWLPSTEDPLLPLKSCSVLTIGIFWTKCVLVLRWFWDGHGQEIVVEKEKMSRAKCMTNVKNRRDSTTNLNLLCTEKCRRRIILFK